jgi:L-lactate dehydrogenase complex protein LldG
MEESTSREKVLKKIRNALISKEEVPYPDIDLDSSIYDNSNEPLEIQFAQALNKASGKFIYCESESEFINKLDSLKEEFGWSKLYASDPVLKEIFDVSGFPYVSDDQQLIEADAGITQCEFLIARLGSVMVSSAQVSGRRSFAYPETHIVIAYTSQLVPDIRQAIDKVSEKYPAKMPSMISIITGPSRTADIEKTLVMGAHGPRDLYVFLIEDQI